MVLHNDPAEIAAQFKKLGNDLTGTMDGLKEKLKNFQPEFTEKIQIKGLTVEIIGLPEKTIGIKIQPGIATTDVQICIINAIKALAK